MPSKFFVHIKGLDGRSIESGQKPVHHDNKVKPLAAGLVLRAFSGKAVVNVCVVAAVVYLCFVLIVPRRTKVYIDVSIPTN